MPSRRWSRASARVFRPLKGASAALLEGELAFEGVEDGFDPLPDPAEFADAWLPVLPVGSDKVLATPSSGTATAA